MVTNIKKNKAFPSISVYDWRMAVIDVAKLREEQVLLVKLVGRLGAYIAQPVPPPQSELFALRREISTKLIAHLKAEDWVLYPRLLMSPDRYVAATARVFIQDMGGLAGTFAAYSERWKASAIAVDWTGYCRDSSGIIDAIIDRITRENRDLYPLVEELERAA